MNASKRTVIIPDPDAPTPYMGVSIIRQNISQPQGQGELCSRCSGYGVRDGFLTYIQTMGEEKATAMGINHVTAYNACIGCGGSGLHKDFFARVLSSEFYEASTYPDVPF